MCIFCVFSSKKCVFSCPVNLICIKSYVKVYLNNQTSLVFMSKISKDKFEMLSLLSPLFYLGTKPKLYLPEILKITLSHETYLPKKHLGKVVSLRFRSLMRWPCLLKRLYSFSPFSEIITQVSCSIPNLSASGEKERKRKKNQQ